MKKSVYAMLLMGALAGNLLAAAPQVGIDNGSFEGYILVGNAAKATRESLEINAVGGLTSFLKYRIPYLPESWQNSMEISSFSGHFPQSKINSSCT